MIRKFFSSLSNRVIAGFISGVAAALIFGHYIIWLMPVGHIYVMLLQMVVYPYLVSMLVASLGRLSDQDIKHLLKYMLWAYLVLLAIVFASQFLAVKTFSLMVHGYRPVVDHSTSIWSSIEEVLVPRNIIKALSHDFVPAIIVFAVLFGLALRKSKKAEVLLSFFDGVSAVSLSYWRILMRFAPIGVFALVSATLAKVNVHHFSLVLQFTLLFFFIVFILSFYLFPVLAMQFAGLRYQSFFEKLQTGLVISVTTGISALALPYIQRAVVELFNIEETDQNGQRLISTTSNIAYPFAQVGNFFIWLFMVMAVEYFMVPIHFSQSTALPFFSYISAIGSPSSVLSSVFFLSNWLDLPTKAVSLFTEIFPIVRYGQVLVSVVGISFIVILVMAQYCGFVWRIKRMILSLLIYFLVLIGFCFFCCWIIFR